MPVSTIALLTDFGFQDPFVGIMKGVILARAPEARIVDLAHGIEPQDLRAGALALLSAFDYFPEGTLFVCVIDPGVGSARRILWARAGRHQFLAPDNGVLSWLPRRAPLRELRSVANARLFLKPVGSTFHGRDRFAPAAAALARGLSPEELGPRARSPRRMPFPPVLRRKSKITGEILAIDRFGNAVTNLETSAVGRRSLRFNGVELGAPRPSYSAVPVGRPVAVRGSLGFVELSVREGSFARSYRAKPGDPVHA